MRSRTMLLIIALLLAAIPALPGPAHADAFDTVVFHDEVVKWDPVGDVTGSNDTPVDIRKVTYDHYKLSDGREDLTINAYFARLKSSGTTFHFGASTGAGGYSIEVLWTPGKVFRLKRAGSVISSRGISRTIDGRRIIIVIPWRKLGRPRNIVGPGFWADRFMGVDEAMKWRAVLR